MQRVLLGSLAAGGATLALDGSQAEAQVTSEGGKRLLTLTIDRRRPPRLEELVSIVAKATGILGCTDCGFGGIDVLVKVNPVINPQPTAWAAEVEQIQGFAK